MNLLTHSKRVSYIKNQTPLNIPQNQNVTKQNNKIIYKKFSKSQQDIPLVDLNKTWAWLKKSY